MGERGWVPKGIAATSAYLNRNCFAVLSEVTDTVERKSSYMCHRSLLISCIFRRSVGYSYRH